MFEKKTMADYVYEKLKEAIVFLEYEPGEKLSEIQLSQIYNVSRSPIREALAKLENDGLVIIKPQSGTIISEISFKKAQEMLVVRRLLEPYASKIAATKITDNQLDELQMRLDRLAKMEQNSEEKRKYVTEVDVYLHDTILDACGNEEISKVIKSFRPVILRVNRANLQWRNRLEPVQKEMVAIFQKLRERDAEGAYKVMQDHLSNFHIHSTKMLKNEGEFKGE